MSAPRVIPNKRCAQCRRHRRPRSWEQFHNPTWCCSRSCSSQRLYPGMQKILAAATAARNRRLHRRRIEATVRRTFGELSVREIQLFNLGVKIGYDRGYAKAYDRRTAHQKDTAA